MVRMGLALTYLSNKAKQINSDANSAALHLHRLFATLNQAAARQGVEVGACLSIEGGLFLCAFGLLREEGGAVPGVPVAGG